eukprot:Pgem_evm1s3302
MKEENLVKQLIAYSKARHEELHTPEHKHEQEHEHDLIGNNHVDGKSGLVVKSTSTNANSTRSTSGSSSLSIFRKSVPKVSIGEYNKLYNSFLDTDSSWFTVQVDCRGGTYMRSLIRDIGLQLNSRATCQSIIRTSVGCFSISKDNNSDSVLDFEELDLDMISQALSKSD